MKRKTKTCPLSLSMSDFKICSMTKHNHTGEVFVNTLSNSVMWDTDVQNRDNLQRYDQKCYFSLTNIWGVINDIVSYKQSKWSQNSNISAKNNDKISRYEQKIDICGKHWLKRVYLAQNRIKPNFDKNLALSLLHSWSHNLLRRLRKTEGAG